MKRTERLTIALTKDEKARIRIEASDLHISMSALVRMRVFAPQIAQYQHTPQKRRLPSIPGTIKVDLNYMERNKFVADNPTLMFDFSVEMKLKMKERKNKIDSYEETLADEVGIE
jgi:hypothetical protein